MRLEGIHHITAITGDAPRNVDFYTRVLGLRMVKKTRQPGRPDRLPPLLRRRARQRRGGPDVLRVPGRPARPRGRGHGAPDRVARRLRGRAVVLGRAARRRGRRRSVGRGRASLRFADPEGLEHELAVDASGDEPLIAEHPEVPAEHRAARVRRRPRVRRTTPSASRALLERALAFEPVGRRLGGARRARAAAPTPTTRRPTQPGIQGAGTVHHVAWATPPAEQEAWRERGAARGRAPDAGDRPLLLQVRLLPRAERGAVRDRHDRPGLHDRRAARVARRASSSLPPDYEHLRAQIEATVTPLPPTRPRPQLSSVTRERVLRGVLAVLRRAIGGVGGRRRLPRATRGRPRRRPRARRARRRAPAPSRRAPQHELPRVGDTVQQVSQLVDAHRASVTGHLPGPYPHVRTRSRGGCRDDLGQAAASARDGARRSSATSAASARSSAARYTA